MVPRHSLLEELVVNLPPTTLLLIQEPPLESVPIHSAEEGLAALMHSHSQMPSVDKEVWAEVNSAALVVAWEAILMAEWVVEWEVQVELPAKCLLRK